MSLSMIQHVVSTVDVSYGLQIDGLSFFYACKAYYSFKPLLEFLALVRLRLQTGQLFLNGSSSPLTRLHILNLPNELSHEIFKLVFESLLEDEKLKVLDRLGLCSHVGICELGSFHERFPCQPEYVGYRVQACACMSCIVWSREMRDESFKEGEGGVCLVDCGSGEECCSDQAGYHPSKMYGGNEVKSCCRFLAGCRAAEMLKIFSEGEGEIFAVITDFNLSVLAYPTIVPPFCTDHDDHFIGLDIPIVPYLHAGIALPHVGTQHEQDVAVPSRASCGCGRTKLRDHSLIQVAEVGRPSEDELERFQSLAKGLRLVGAGEDAKKDFEPSPLVLQSLQVTNLEEVF